MYWQRPYQVVNYISKDVYLVAGEGKHDDKTEEVHVDLLHPFVKLREQTVPLQYTKEWESRHCEDLKYPDYVPRGHTGSPAQ